MKRDTVSQTSDRITSIIRDHGRRTKQLGISIELENVSGCKGSEMKLELRMLYDGYQHSEIVSDCLSADEGAKIHETISTFCKESNGKYAMKE